MWKLFIPIPFLCLFIACATQVAPKGGPKDEQAPVLDTLESTASLQTNFEKKRIELSFNEWVQLNDVFNQVVVSPPLEHRPKIVLRGRTVRFEFDEEEILKEKTTYTINFGEAVKDLTEGNVAKDLRYVFSTGDFIDSLEVSGRVVDAFTAKPSENVLVMLYENLADSVVRTERPYYFAKTDKQGAFRIQNVKASTFKVFALVDQNFNYLFDIENEQIAFANEPIVLNDSARINLKLQLFEETKKLQIIEEETDQYGRVKLMFNQEPKGLQASYESIGQIVNYDYDKDTLNVWYQNTEDRSWNLYLQQDTSFFDTIFVKALDREAFVKATKLQAKKGLMATHNPTKAFPIAFNHPLMSFDTSLLRIYEDSVGVRLAGVLNTDSAQEKTLKIKFPWKENRTYLVQLLPGAVEDIYGVANDSIFHTFIANALKTYGNMTIKVEGLVRERNYVLQLFDAKDVLIEVMYPQGVDNFSKIFSTMPVGEYKLILIEDLNNNQRWDPGNYDQKLQPEKIYTKQTEKLRANWDLEVLMNIE
ncbi:MAG: Ig-like domain-containing protein [Saprospiraceae bacterium]